jgi:hypothetical protein
MTEAAQLLHNMSTPPKSVVKYNGLRNDTKTTDIHGTGAGWLAASNNGAFGSFVTFRLPGNLRRCGAETILKRLGLKAGSTPEKTLLDLIEARAKELVLPDACVVIPTKTDSPCPWPDPLAILAVITKSSASVWLRSKTPRLSALRKTSAVSLLVPPTFVDQIEGLSS